MYKPLEWKLANEKPSTLLLFLNLSECDSNGIEEVGLPDSINNMNDLQP